tara:strand:+ start:12944 stop:13240 length:297 start_codon:yes stop_codon:yes gene_type:complete
LEWLFDFGPFEQTDNGFRPVSYQEIKAWSDITGIKLVEDEAEILHGLSREYCIMLNKAKSRNCNPPYVHGALEQNEEVAMRAKVAMQFQALKKHAKKA